MKIWSREHLETITRDKSTRTIGVLAHKFPRSIQSNHPIYGSGLLISQAIRLTDEVSLRFEDDFITIPLMAEYRGSQCTSPALMCDLLIASRAVYESVPGLGGDLQTRILTKWLAKSGEASIVNLLPQLYRWASFPEYYKEYLTKSYSALNLEAGCQETTKGTVKICIHSNRVNNSSRCGYRAVMFEPLRKEQHIAVKRPQAPSPSFRVTLIWESQYQMKPWQCPTRVPLTRGDASTTGTLFINSEDRDYQVLETKIGCLATELTVLPLLYMFYPRDRLQKLIAVDPTQQKAFYSHQGGSRLLDLRIQSMERRTLYHETNAQIKEPHSFERWLLSIHTCMAQDVMSVYQASWMPPGSETRTVRPHVFHDRLQLGHWLDNPVMTGLASAKQMSTDTFIDLPIFVNGHCYGSLRNQLDRATRALDPSAPHFDKMPTIFGLGEGHGWNVLVTGRVGKGTMPGLKYINDGQAGFYSPLMDISGSLYVDAFFPALFADIWTGDLSESKSAVNSGIQLRWEIDDEAISIDYELVMSILDRSLATAKLEYIVRPTFDMLDAHAPQQNGDGKAQMGSELWEQLLGNGMFCCALLSRDFHEHRPDVFMLNLALGMRLAQDMKGTFEEIFDWRRFNL